MNARGIPRGLAAVALACLAFALPALARAQGVDAMSSIVIVAKKDMRDPFFHDSVVLVTHRFGVGPIGVIVNKPTGIVVNREFPAAKRPAGEVVFFGGPVATEYLVAAFRAKERPEGAVEVLEGVFMTMRRTLIDELMARDPPAQDLRVFAGHSAWAFGQLENEIGRGDWHLVRAEGSILFEPRPESLWRDLERRAAAKSAGFRPRLAPPAPPASRGISPSGFPPP